VITTNTQGARVAVFVHRDQVLREVDEVSSSITVIIAHSTQARGTARFRFHTTVVTHVQVHSPRPTIMVLGSWSRTTQNLNLLHLN
jgi:hypothetical protein